MPTLIAPVSLLMFDAVGVSPVPSPPSFAWLFSAMTSQATSTRATTTPTLTQIANQLTLRGCRCHVLFSPTRSLAASRRTARDLRPRRRAP